MSGKKSPKKIGLIQHINTSLLWVGPKHGSFSLFKPQVIFLFSIFVGKICKDAGFGRFLEVLSQKLVFSFLYLIKFSMYYHLRYKILVNKVEEVEKVEILQVVVETLYNSGREKYLNLVEKVETYRNLVEKVKSTTWIRIKRNLWGLIGQNPKKEREHPVSNLPFDNSLLPVSRCSLYALMFTSTRVVSVLI